jgi:hypothetical protein
MVSSLNHRWVSISIVATRRPGPDGREAEPRVGDPQRILDERLASPPSCAGQA